MPAERFYLDQELKSTVTLIGVEHHHLAHVMRIRVGEEVELVNGKGSLATAKVESISKHDAQLKVISVTHTPVAPPHLILAIPLMRPAKLELVIEKCTELGADAFLLYPAHFSEKEDLSEHQFERLQQIAINAMKQCGRLDLPPIKRSSFDALFKEPVTLLFGDTRNAQMPKKIEGPILFVTGPEKGFFEKELKSLDSKGTGIRLHKNILRAETAPIAVAVLYSTN